MLGGWDAILQILVLFVVIDYITGVICAIDKRVVSSKVGFKGILKKLCIMFSVVIATQFDKILNQDNFCRQVVCLFYISNEAISILENLNNLGVPVPKILKQTIEKMHDESEGDK